MFVLCFTLKVKENFLWTWKSYVLLAKENCTFLSDIFWFARITLICCRDYRWLDCGWDQDQVCLGNFSHPLIVSHAVRLPNEWAFDLTYATVSYTQALWLDRRRSSPGAQQEQHWDFYLYVSLWLTGVLITYSLQNPTRMINIMLTVSCTVCCVGPGVWSQGDIDWLET